MREGKGSDTVLVEITGAFVNQFGRLVEPTYLSVFRMLRSYADELVRRGVANILPLPSQCIRTELNRRRKEMQSKGMKI
ncbi:MAG TPA: hypothetical protein PKH94_07275 [Bacteroidales bacterium]|nr:hypothetical protein [Bacteroidales bacterium]